MDDKESPQRSPQYVHAGGAAVALDDVVLQLKIGISPEFLDLLVRRKIAAAIANKRGISPDDEAVEAALIEFYTDHDLFEEQQILDWLKMMQLEESAVRAYAAETALIECAKLEIVSDEKVEERFGSEHHIYTIVETDRFEFATVGQAREFILAVRENEFTPAGGARSHLTRRDAPEEIAAELFSADRGDLIGPVENEDGSFGVFLFHEHNDAVLDDDLRENIREEMFTELVEAELGRAPVKFVK